MSVRAAITAAALAIAAGGPVHAMDSSGHDTVLNLARENGCILRDADAALTDAGYSDAETRERIILTLVDQRKASRIGDALMVRGAACQQGPKPGLRDRFLAGFGTNADCALGATDLDRTMLRYALTSQDVALLRAEMEGGKDLIASADGTELRLKPAHCERAQDLAKTVVPDHRDATVAFMAAHDCRIGTRDLEVEIAEAGLDPVATEIAIEALVTEGDAIYYGNEETLILLWERCQ